MMMLIPEAWEKDPEMPADRKAFYEYHGGVIEPWDGPASIAFTDGTLIGATLDRNGLRPSRYCLTDDNLLIMASEAGVLDVPPEKVVQKGRLQPGKMFVASLEEGRIIPDEEIKARICAEQPYQQWLDEGKIPLAELEPPREVLQPPDPQRADQAEGLRLHARGPAHPHGADGQGRPGAGRLDGHRHAAGGAVGQVAQPLRLLPAALRPGHQPAHRPHPRGDGDEPGLLRGRARATCSRPAPSTRA